MNRARIWAAAAVWMIAGLAAGCATSREATDLVTYVNQGVLDIGELETKALERYNSVMGANYTTDQRVLEVLGNEVIPLYKRFLDGLRNIHPETEEVKNLHQIYLRGAEQLYEGFKQILYGVELGNEEIVRSGNEKIEKCRVEIQKFQNQLEFLIKKYKIKEARK